jgi:hypothetical protein
MAEEAEAAGWEDVLVPLVQVNQDGMAAPSIAPPSRAARSANVKHSQPDKWTGKETLLPPHLWMQDMLTAWGSVPETLKRMPGNMGPQARVRWDALVRSKWGGQGWENRMPWETAQAEFERLEGFDPRAAKEEARQTLLSGD